jgi:hypothetical protein
VHIEGDPGLTEAAARSHEPCRASMASVQALMRLPLDKRFFAMGNA